MGRREKTILRGEEHKPNGARGNITVALILFDRTEQQYDNMTEW